MAQQNPPKPPRWRDDIGPDPNPGLKALVDGAADAGRRTQISLDALEKELRDRQQERLPYQDEPIPPPLPVRRSPGPLSEEAKLLKSKSILMGAQKVAEDAKQAAAAFVADALELQAEVDRWAKVLEAQADQMAETIARHHDALLKARRLFQQAMTVEQASDEAQPGDEDARNRTQE